MAPTPGASNVPRANTTSTSGLFGNVGQANYGSAKAGIAGLTIILSMELGRYGVTVNAIAPAIWTPMYDKTRSEMTPEQLAAHDAMMAKAVPLGGRLGDIETDFVPVLAFYASPGAKFMTGQTISVDGGTLMVR